MLRPRKGAKNDRPTVQAPPGSGAGYVRSWTGQRGAVDRCGKPPGLPRIDQGSWARTARDLGAWLNHIASASIPCFARPAGRGRSVVSRSSADTSSVVRPSMPTAPSMLLSRPRVRGKTARGDASCSASGTPSPAFALLQGKADQEGVRTTFCRRSVRANRALSALEGEHLVRDAREAARSKAPLSGGSKGRPDTPAVPSAQLLGTA